MNTKLKIGFSPCPNDTFMFDAMVHHKIDTLGLDFDFVLADVEELNQKAFDQTFDVTKLSFFAYTHLVDKYQLLNSGSALGNNCGPIVVSKKQYSLHEIQDKKIAIPGKYTTANFLLHYAVPNLPNTVELIFSDIEKAILDDRVDAGVIIHENRFTYEEKGLFKVVDLGEYWQDNTNLPIPLGGIAVKRTLSADVKEKVDHILQESIKYGFNNPDSGKEFIKKNAQEMDDEVIQKHIDLYVNSYSINLGEKGKKAVNTFIENANKFKLIPTVDEERIFI